MAASGKMANYSNVAAEHTFFQQRWSPTAHCVRTLAVCYLIWGDVCQLLSFQATFLHQRISVQCRCTTVF